MTEAGTQTPEITTPAHLQDYSRIADKIRSFVKNPDALPTRKGDLVELLGRLKHDWNIILKLRAELVERGLTFARINGDSQISFFEQQTNQPSYVDVTTTLITPLPMSELDIQTDFISAGHPNPNNLKSIRISKSMPTQTIEPSTTTEVVAEIFMAHDARVELFYSEKKSDTRTVQLANSC